MRRLGNAVAAWATVAGTAGDDCPRQRRVLPQYSGQRLQQRRHTTTTTTTEPRSGASERTSARNSTTGPRPNVKLDLNLQLDKIDFVKVVKNTREAESMLMHSSPLTRSVLEELDGLQRSLPPRHASADGASHTTPPAQPEGTGPRSNRAGLFVAAQSSSPSLKQRLQDCLSTGDWPTAVKLFDGALAKSLEHVGGAVAAPPLAAESLPPTNVAITLFAPELARVGVGRWSGNHLRTLLECLILADAQSELDRVWGLLRRLDAFRKRFDAFIVNGLLVALRRRSDTAGAHWRDQRAVRQARDGAEEAQQRLQNLRATKRECALELGELASEQGWILRESSWDIVEWFRTSEGAALADSVEHAPSLSTSGSPSPTASDVSASAARTNPALSTTTWNKMLQEATTYAQAQAIVHKMEALKIPVDDSTYAFLVRCAARCPLARDVAVDEQPGDEERAAAATTTAVAAAGDETRRGADDQGTAAAVTTTTTTAVPSDDDADRNLPLVWDALAMFHRAFPGRYPSSRLMVEVLHLLKGRRRHDAKLYEMVSLMLVPGESVKLLECVGPSAETRAVNDVSGDAHSHSSPPESVHTVDSAEERPSPQSAETAVDQKKSSAAALNWGARPSGKLFETMIRHSLHMQRYSDCWWWYHEMLCNKVRGTGVVYHTMIEVASAHGDAHGQKRNGRAAVLSVYRDMRDAGHDVTGVNTTVNLINAWTSNRRRPQ